MQDEKVAIAILNRNTPELADELVEQLSILNLDTFVLENGSDIDKYSKYANLTVEESNGVSWGVNYLLEHCLSAEYDYVWLNYNDARFEKPKEFLEWSISVIKEDPSIGIVTGYWPNVWDMVGRKNSGNPVVSFFDPLSFVISRRALEITRDTGAKFTPFWDSSNYAGHYNILGPAVALYRAGMKMIVNYDFPMTEKNIFVNEIQEIKDEKSRIARGFSNEEWIHEFGPKVAHEWLNGFFPELAEKDISAKKKRDIVISHIGHIYHNYSEEK